jgi:hypothetical protein
MVALRAGDFWKKKKLVGGLETKNDAFLGVFMAK